MEFRIGLAIFGMWYTYGLPLRANDAQGSVLMSSLAGSLSEEELAELKARIAKLLKTSPDCSFVALAGIYRMAQCEIAATEDTAKEEVTINYEGIVFVPES